MKKIYIISIFILTNFSISSQVFESVIKRTETLDKSGEEIKLFTDRNIYCVNENIYFTAEYSSIKALDTLDWSNVLYVELIQWDGGKLVQMKLELNKPETSACMKIPDDLRSGNYYLRAYTKWMRNFSPKEYAYQMVKVVNPFNDETNSGPAIELTNQNHEQKTRINNVYCFTDKKEYKKGEKVNVELLLKNNNVTDFNRYCVSVVKLGIIDTVEQVIQLETNPDRITGTITYLPEIRGITLSGKIVDKESNQPVLNVPISLSETQKGEYFSVNHSNEIGQFIFSLPDLNGQHDFFIQATDVDSANVEIFVDNGFCSKPLQLPFIPFGINDTEKELVHEMMINMQLNELFLTKHDSMNFLNYSTADTIPFYGNKKATYYTKNYIELPNFGEFVNEIISEASFSVKRGTNAFISMKRDDNLFYPPLVLIDNIQVENNEKLFMIPLNRIERVEIINADYVVSNKKYTGIISISTKNNDFAGLDLNKNGMFLTYDLFSEPNQYSNSSIDSTNNRIPQRLNTLYWNPNIQLSADKKSTISFYTTDSKGRYIIYVRDKNNSNENHIFGSGYFSVK